MVTNKPPLPYQARPYIMPGDAACPGCPIPIGLKLVGAALGEKTIVTVPASCTSVVVGASPGTSVRLTMVHTAFASAAAVASGIKEALEIRGIKDRHVIVWAGDGGTADIGMATLSGAAERNNDIIYIMYDNEAYMNTGIQRSSSTPKGAWTTTTPVKGKIENKKDVAKIMIAHNIPYVATASIAFPHDFVNKLNKAKNIKGFKFIHLHAPCPVGWRFDPKDTINIARLAVETGLWILYEYSDGKIKISGPSMRYIKKENRKPIKEYLEKQGRFKSVSEEFVKEIEKYVEDNWNWIMKLAK